MKMTVNNRFGILLAEKRIKERRPISLVEVAEATKISRQALYKWQNNSIDRFEVRVIDALCEYFEIQPGELFHYVKPQDGLSGKITVKHIPSEDGQTLKTVIDKEAKMEKVFEMISQPKMRRAAKPVSQKKASRKKKPAA